MKSIRIKQIIDVGLIIFGALVLIVTHALDAPHALMLAGCGIALFIVWPRDLPPTPSLPEPPRHSHAGARSDLSYLSWAALERDGRVSRRVIARILALTSDDPVLASLRRIIEGTRSPTPAQVFGWLSVIDAVEKRNAELPQTPELIEATNRPQGEQ